MRELHPDAQAVMDAFLAGGEIGLGHGIAAALRAAVSKCSVRMSGYETRCVPISDLLSLVEELEAQG